MNIKSRKLLSILLTLALALGLSAAFPGPAQAALPTPVRPALPLERPGLGGGTLIAAGYEHTVGLKADGSVLAVGSNDDNQLDVSTWTNIVAVAAGGWNTVGLKEDGTVLAVGRDNNSQLNVSGWTDIVAVAAGALHTVGLKAGGTVLAVGSNTYGQLDVSGWTDIVAVAAGAYHTVGLKADGSVLAVGSNVDCQLDVSTWTDIVAVDAGGLYTVGLKVDGTVLAVGSNTYGQLNVSGWSDIVAVAAGDYHTVGLKADGTVLAVSLNDYGQCDTQSWHLREGAAIFPSVLPGTYSAPFQLQFSSAPGGYELYYTTDGRDPKTAGLTYLSGINIYKTTTIRAISKLNGLFGPEYTFTYIISPALTANYPGGSYNDPFALTLTSAIGYYNIYYTTGGSDPRISGLPYDGAIDIHKTTTLKAAPVYIEGGVEAWGAVTTFEYVFPAVSLSVTPSGGTYGQVLTVTINCNIGSYAVYYTLNGGEEILYTKPFVLDADAELTAMAKSGGIIMGYPVTENYAFTGLAYVTASPAPGEYGGPISVALTSSNPMFSDIYYTLDGSAPYESGGLLYNGPISIEKTTTLKVTPKTPGASGQWGRTDTFAYVLPSGADIAIDLGEIGLTPPVAGAMPERAIRETPQYTGTVSWSAPAPPINPRTFAFDTVYTATITLTPKTGYTLDGVTADFFTVKGAAKVANAANSGLITAVFPATDPIPLTAVSIPYVSLTPPVAGAAPDKYIKETAQYTGEINWSGNPIVFDYETAYTATIILTPKAGYTFQGVAADFFIVDGAKAKNEAGSGKIEAVFPATGPKAAGLQGDVNGDGKVDATDLSMLISDFGKTGGYNPGSDINKDGKVDATDLSILLSNFGKS